MEGLSKNSTNGDVETDRIILITNSLSKFYLHSRVIQNYDWLERGDCEFFGWNMWEEPRFMEKVFRDRLNMPKINTYIEVSYFRIRNQY